ncbi:MAG TPA: hypothetical protein VGG60_11495 [Candidatus Binataceae bacterium]|jgi:hypothetical protein
MSSDRQIVANRLNARHSTGPRTAVGMARASSNALKHGLTGKHIVLPGENPRHYDAFREGLIESLDPIGDLEGLLADKIIADAWRVRRVPIFEAARYQRGRQELAIEHAQREVRKSRSAEAVATFAAMTGMPTRSRARTKAERKLEEAEAERQNLLQLNPSLDASRVLEDSVVTFANLWRQERALTRSILRNLHELQRLQAIRAGENVPAPTVIDVNFAAHRTPAVPFESE